MNVSDARALVQSTIARMNTLYNASLFDEWVLLKLGEPGAILAYDGPRAESYQKRFRTDVALMQQHIGQRSLAVGDFEFVPEARGTYYDACVRVGPAAYLFCNNTAKAMRELRESPLWLGAQKPFAELAAKFANDPLD